MTGVDRVAVAAALALCAIVSCGTRALENVAFGARYTVSQLPTTEWYDTIRERGGQLPDPTQVLTDGRFARSPSFWTSERSIGFLRGGPVDIVVDLGALKRIRTIRSRHGARPDAGIRLPRLQEYFISFDGREFAKIAEDRNEKDPDAPAPAHSLYSGIKGFTSGRIDVHGRYVRIRTHPSLDRERFGQYVGFDEIEILGEEPGEERLDTSLTGHPEPEVVRHPFDHDTRSQDWIGILAETPLYLTLAPHGFVGDDRYQLSRGGVFVLAFEASNHEREPIEQLSLRVRIPETIEVIDIGGAQALLGSSRRESGEEIRFHYPNGFPSKPLAWPYLVIAVRSEEPPGSLGHVDWDYSYRGSKSIPRSRSGRVELVHVDRILAPRPTRFATGFWLPFAARHLSQPASTLPRLFRFYADLGFTMANGGQPGPSVASALEAIGLENFTGNGLSPNGLMFALWNREIWNQVPRAHHFEAHPAERRVRGICPTRFASSAYDGLRTALARGLLRNSRHIYDNWEPYMFQKRGCVCEACRAAFAAFTGLSESEVSAIWPDVVRDVDSELHNAFTSAQYAEILRRLELAVTRAGEELGRDQDADFVPSMSFDVFDVRHRVHRWNDPSQWLPHLDRLALWRYTHRVAKTAPDGPQRVGNNLALLPAFENALRFRRGARSRQAESEAVLMYYLGTESYREFAVQPSDAYFSTLLAFVEGFDGVGAWTQTFKPDARFLRAQAAAHTAIARFEDFVAQSTSSPPVVIEPSGVPVHARAFAGEGEFLVAVGNDGTNPVTVRLEINGLPEAESWRLAVEEAGLPVSLTFDSESPHELTEGLRVTLDPKAWHFLRLEAVASAESPGS